MGELLQASIEMSDDQLDRIVRRAAEIVLETTRQEAGRGTYLSVGEAADIMRCRPQRIHDLLSQRRLTRIKDGRRTLLLRAELEAYLRGGPTGASQTPLRWGAA